MTSARTRVHALSNARPPSALLGLALAASAALAACGGGSGDSDTQRKISTAVDAAAAAAGGSGASSLAADTPASAASAALAAASAAEPTQQAAVARVNGENTVTPSRAATTTTPTTPTNATPTAAIAAAGKTFAAPAPAATFGNTLTTDPVAAAAPAAVTSTQPRQAAQAEAALTSALASTQVNELLTTSGLLLPVRVATENFAAARITIANNSGWASWISQRRSNVDKWFAKPHDRLDLRAGLPNDYVDPKTGAPVTWTDDSVEPPAGTTDKEKAYKGAWVAILRQVNISYALDAARLYQVTGDSKYAETAAGQLDFYADSYNKWPLSGNSRMFGQTLEEATTVLQMLETARALAPYATATRKAKWRDGLFFPMAANLQLYSWGGSLNNINLWCAVATAAIGMEHGNAAWTDAGLTGPRSVAAVMAKGITQDGVWYEGSFAYNNYVLLALARLFDLAAAAGRADIVTKYASSAQRMLLAPVLYRFDDGSLPSPNDSRNTVTAVDKPTHGALYRHVPTSYGVQYAASNRSWDTLRDPPPSNSATPTLPATKTTFSPDTGFASLRSGNWQVFVHYGQKILSHAQAEALGYELAVGSTNIARDAGTSNSYGSPEHLEYFSQGPGNNVPLVDGQGPEGISMGEVKAFDPKANSLDVLQASYRTDVSARRTYKVNTDGFIESTQLSVTKAGGAPRRMGIVFNTTCAVQIADTRAGTPASSAAPAGSTGFKYWKAVTRQTATQPTWTAKLTCGARNFEMTVTGPAGHLIYRGTVPSTPLPATRNSIYVESTGLNASFTTSFREL